jgi:hypothetical protein
MIGPSLPPHLQGKITNDDLESSEPIASVEDEDDDDYGPALPPALAARRAAANQPVKNYNVAPEELESGSDDEIGPKLPSRPSEIEADDAVHEFKERERRRNDLKEVDRVSLYFTSFKV